MSCLASQTFEALSRWLAALKSMCSLRKLVLLLPSGTPAPRLNINLPLKDEEYRSSLGLISIDDTYTSTTSLTDFDEGVVADYAFGLTHTSTPSCAKPAYLGARARSNPKHCRSIPVLSDGGGYRCFPKIQTLHSDDALGGHLSSSEYRAKRPAKARKLWPARRNHAKYPKRYNCRRKRSARTHSLTHSSSNVESSSSDLSDVQGIQKPKNPCSGAVFESDPQRMSDAAPVESQHSDRITYLETELARLRSQLAQLIIRQENKQPIGPSPLITTCDQRLDGDGEEAAVSVFGEETRSVPPYITVDSDYPPIAQWNQRPAIPPPASTTIIPPPPSSLPIPPPPPPFPTMVTQPTIDWRAELIAKKNKKQNIATSENNPSTPTTGCADMSQVLKELQSGSIRLRTVPRSPGGTPIRAHEAVPQRDRDPHSIITEAMRNQLRKLRAALELSASGAENTPNSSAQESSLQHADFSPASNDKPETDSSHAPFGQHLLRPTRNPNSFSSPAPVI